MAVGALVGLGVGIGLLSVWSAFALPDRPHEARGPSRLSAMLSRAGLPSVSPTALGVVCAALGLVVLGIVHAASRTLPVSIVFGGLAAYLPIGLVRQRIIRRRREFAEVWPDTVDNLASAVRAGMSLPDALASLAVTGPEVLRGPFERFAVDYQVTGRFGDCLDRLKESLSDPVGDRVVEGLRIAREVGGGELGRLLRSLSSHLRDDARTRSELESRQAWTVNGARLAVAAPWAVLLLMSFQSDVVRRYESPSGVLVLVLGALACVLAYVVMIRIGRLPTEQRILA